MVAQHFTQQQIIAMLAWQIEMGADEAVLDWPSRDLHNLRPSGDTSKSSQAPPSVSNLSLPFSAPSRPAVSVGSPPVSAQTSPALPANLDHIISIFDLAVTLDQLDNCPLKHTASTLCFSDGNAGARLMIIGEAPGRDEDRLGVPFVGGSGQFLDQMLSSIGLDRSGVYLTNLLPWRPPGNRTATAEEVSMLLPYLYRHVQLSSPELVVILGGVPAKAIFRSDDNILNIRGRWRDIDYGDGVMRPTMASLHPAYLMRSPAQKRLAFEEWCGLYHRLHDTLPPSAA